MLADPIYAAQVDDREAADRRQQVGLVAAQVLRGVVYKVAAQ